MLCGVGGEKGETGMMSLCGLPLIIAACIAILGIGGCTVYQVKEHHNKKPKILHRYDDVGKSPVDEDLEKE